MSGRPPPLVICGPSGVGKSVLIKYLQGVFPDKFGFSVSHTTRAPRPGEEDGVAYHFSDLETMKREVEAGLFIESAMVHGNMYGTSREAVNAVSRAGKICVLDIDVQGAKTIKESACFEQVRFVFIHPPSMEELERRLRGRGTEVEEKVLKRLANARHEVAFSRRVAFFDHAFVLDGLKDGNVPRAVHELCALLQAWYPSLAAAGAGLVLSLRAREVLDSRGRPTVEVDLRTPRGLFRAAAPGGAPAEPRGGAGPLGPLGPLGCGAPSAAAVNDVLAPRLLGRDCAAQAEVDALLAGLGRRGGPLAAGARLAVSMAACRAGAAARGAALHEHLARLAGGRTDAYVLPVPALHALSGGRRAGNRLACREFMLLPTGARSFKEAMVLGAEVYHALKKVIKGRYGQDACNVGDEGGFAPSARDDGEALEVLMQAIRQSGHDGRVRIAIDAAASAFYDAGSKLYDLDFKNPSGSSEMRLTAEQLMSVYRGWFAQYPIVSIEDPFDQEDWEAHSKFASGCGSAMQIVGDDLLVTNTNRIQRASEARACNALLLRINQIGTITEAIEACKMAHRAGWGVMVSHQSGETEDTFIADLAVGLCTGQIKTGAPCRSERLAKYNQLIRIEEELGPIASFAGETFRTSGLQ